jgi:hypothetical protein
VENLKMKLQAQGLLLAAQKRDLDKLITTVSELKRKSGAGRGDGA